MTWLTTKSSQMGQTETNWITLLLVLYSDICLFTLLCIQEYSGSAMEGCWETFLTLFEALEGPAFAKGEWGVFSFPRRLNRKRRSHRYSDDAWLAMGGWRGTLWGTSFVEHKRGALGRMLLTHESSLPFQHCSMYTRRSRKRSSGGHERT